MKKQAHKPSTARSAKALTADGSKIASEARVLNQEDFAMDLNPVHPIDTLLVQQLEDLLDGEKALHARYSAIDSTSDTPEVRMAFSQELSTLRERTDRLYRLMNAMDYYGPYESNDAVLYSPAVA
jgi:hypothetical protein